MSKLRAQDRLAKAISLREADNLEEAKDLLIELHQEHPDDAAVALQCARAHDALGLERAAVQFYEEALRLGLDDEDLKHTLLGLGSTYRTLGDYVQSLTTLNRAVELFPTDRGLRVFQAMALYNNGHAKEACELLLQLLSATTKDANIFAYRRAIDIYATDLDRTWP